MRPSRAFLIFGLLYLVVDLVFLRWVGIHFGNWGFWDWDYQQTLLETARRSILDHGQIPLWNPYIGGGITLAGNTLNHTFSPCFLVILLLGTLPGIKVCIGLYALAGQAGMYGFARALGMGRAGAFLAGLLYMAGGVYAQRLTHGHFEWIAVAWFPFVLWMLEKSGKRLDRRAVALGGLFMAFLFLDGGPYQFAFFGLFAITYTLLRTIRLKSAVPFTALVLVFVLGAGLAAVKLVPVFETVGEFPREVTEDNFYGAPFTPEPVGMLHRAFTARDQYHRPDAWMPYDLNVGSYVGWIPLALALVALVVRFRARWPLALCALLFLWTFLGSVLPFSPWDLFEHLPGLSMLRVPSRFNVFVLLALALFAGDGIEWLGARLATRLKRRGAATLIAGVLTTLVAADLLWVNGRVFKHAFSVPPLKTEAPGPFRNDLHSPFFDAYREAALYDTFVHWPCAAYPAMLENRGVLSSYRTIPVPFPPPVISAEAPAYRGEAWFAKGPGKVVETRITPNRIEAELDGGGGVLVFNTNHHGGWKAEGKGLGEVLNREGLLALDVPAGCKEVGLVYRPASFLYGVAVSGIFLVLWGVILCLPGFRFGKKNSARSSG